MTEYLIRFRSEQWQIGAPGATTGIIEEQCDTCGGRGTIDRKDPADPLGVLRRVTCFHCRGIGRIGRNDPDTIKLCWVTRDGAIICFAGDEDEVACLPE